VAEHFPGFEALEEAGCRFNNCRHRHEPGCAVAGLVASGAVSEERYQTYLSMLTEAEAAEDAASRRSRKK
jgi:ribosome biogenesis GTPase / thiamine phosphate phosphatase